MAVSHEARGLTGVSDLAPSPRRVPAYLHRFLSTRPRESGEVRRLTIGHMTRTKAFLVGLSSGALLFAKWRDLLKTTIKVGLRTSARAQQIAVRGAENIGDVAHDARSELAQDRLSDRDRLLYPDGRRDSTPPVQSTEQI